MATKILVSGPVTHKWTSFVKRVNSANKKAGPFAAVLVSGEVVVDEKSGKSPDLPVYYASSSRLAGEVTSNVHCVGSGSLELIAGLRIVLLAGEDALSTVLTRVDPSLGVDILVLQEWPAGVLQQVPKPLLPEFVPDTYDAQQLLSEISKVGSEAAAEATVALLPRYVFSPGDSFYERPPFRFPSSHCCRFLAMAPSGNTQKQKWLFAASIAPVAVPTDHVDIPGSTLCPLQTTQPRSSGLLTTPTDATGETAPYGRWGAQKPHKKKRRVDEKQLSALAHRGEGQCWFCLASSKVERHLVVSVAQQMYVALAKGPLMPGHCLLLPIVHLSSIVDLPSTALEELERYKEAVRQMAKEQGRVVIFSERNMPLKYGNPHAHVQAMLLKSSEVPLAKQALRAKGVEKHAEWHALPLLKDRIPYEALRDAVEEKNYIWVEFPDEFLYTTEPENLQLQFNRYIVAHAMGEPSKTDWKVCVPTMDEEEKQATIWKANLARLNLPPF